MKDCIPEELHLRNQPDGVRNLDSFVKPVSSLPNLLKNFQSGSLTSADVETMNHSNWTWIR